MIKKSNKQIQFDESIIGRILKLQKDPIFKKELRIFINDTKK